MANFWQTKCTMLSATTRHLTMLQNDGSSPASPTITKSCIGSTVTFSAIWKYCKSFNKQLRLMPQSFVVRVPLCRHSNCCEYCSLVRSCKQSSVQVEELSALSVMHSLQKCVAEKLSTKPHSWLRPRLSPARRTTVPRLCTTVPSRNVRSTPCSSCFMSLRVAQKNKSLRNAAPQGCLCYLWQR